MVTYDNKKVDVTRAYHGNKSDQITLVNIQISQKTQNNKSHPSVSQLTSQSQILVNCEFCDVDFCIKE
jgi:hypothetical protein